MADSFEVVRARNAFYRAMTQVGGNAELERLLPNIQVHLVRAYLRQPRPQRFADYRLISDAIMAGDPQLAEARARSHIGRLTAAVDSLPDSVFAPCAADGTISPEGC